MTLLSGTRLSVAALLLSWTALAIVFAQTFGAFR